MSELTPSELPRTQPNLRYILLDFETTGLNAENDEIIEVGALKMEGFEIVGSYQKLTRPKNRFLGQSLSSRASRMRWSQTHPYSVKSHWNSPIF